jgi:hypothetical protein
MVLMGEAFGDADDCRMDSSNRAELLTTVVGARPADQAGPVAVRTRVVPGRSQCTTSRVRRADWRGGMGINAQESGARMRYEMHTAGGGRWW